MTAPQSTKQTPNTPHSPATATALGPLDTAALDAAVSRAAVLMRVDRAALVVSGADRLRFLHNLWTQSLTDLAPGSVREATLCDVKGALQATALAVAGPDDVTLWVETGRVEAVIARLDRYIIVDDVQLRADTSRRLVELVGPESDAIAAAIGLPSPAPRTTASASVAGVDVRGWREPEDDAFPDAPPGHGAPRWMLELAADAADGLAQALVAAGAVQAGPAAGDALRIVHGRPSLDDDLVGGTLPIELGMREAVSFSKGCYLGQEAIVMMAHRGQLRRHLCWMQPVGEHLPPPGSALKTPAGKRGGRVGTVFVTADGRALGLGVVMRRAYAAGAVLDAFDADGEAAGQVRVVTTTYPRAFEVAPDGVEA